MLDENQKDHFRAIRLHQKILIRMILGAIFFILPYMKFGYAPDWLSGAFLIYIILIVFVSIAILFQNCPICEKKFFVKYNIIFAHYSPLLKKCLHCGASLKY
jgi:membrane protein YdbS with pleckstrin-like domain